MGKGDPAQLAKDAFKLLKPGGTFIVIDHMAKPGRGLADTDTLHRVDPAAVRKIAEGGRLQVRRREQGARTIPPTRSTFPVFDKSIRGHTSQFAYKFVKPN